MRRALVAAMVALALPAAASGSTADVVGDPRSGYHVRYVAASGEVNDLAAEGGAGSITLTDPGAEIAPGSGCEAAGPHSVSCALSCFDVCVSARLGDEKDGFVSEGPPFSVFGGSGDDTLAGGDGRGTLVGDDGDDVLTAGVESSQLLGGADDDELNGGPGSDFLMGGSGADAMDGGGDPGDAGLVRDGVSYLDHADPVTIDLRAPGPAGAAGEGDTLANVENATGGSGADRITATDDVTSDGRGSVVDGHRGDDAIRGGPGADELHGGSGDDRVQGRGGNDRIGGQEGIDVLHGGPGSNHILSMDGPQRDYVDCGDGGTVAPGIASGRLLDVIGQSCRRVVFEYVPVRSVAYRYEGQPTRAVSSTVACSRRCQVEVRLRWHGELIGSAKREIRRGRAGTLTVRLSDEARAKLATTGVLQLRFSLRMRWGQRLRHSQATSWQLRLRHPAPAR